MTEAREDILRRPFNLHEAAFLVATPQEWVDYLVVGREKGLIEALMPGSADGTRYYMRLQLERSFWGRIRREIYDANWRAIEVGEGPDENISRLQIAAYPSPFSQVIAEHLSGKLAPRRLVFEAVDRARAVPERARWEDEAVAYLETWKEGRGDRIEVATIESAINAQFPQYNFSHRSLKRIRMSAGLKQRRGLAPSSN